MPDVPAVGQGAAPRPPTREQTAFYCRIENEDGLFRRRNPSDRVVFREQPGNGSEKTTDSSVVVAKPQTVFGYVMTAPLTDASARTYSMERE